MSDPFVVLKQDVVVEPLVERWYAWAHLVSPATASLNALYRHLALLESFVAAPQVHAAACKNPSLRGGPFVDLSEADVPAVKDLIESTRRRQACQIAFAEALRDAYRLVIKQADGFSIEPLYEQLPEAVKGYVELSYTLGGFPDLRVFESLLYRSPVYDPAAQSSMIYRAKGDDRAFAFSTPRLPRADAFELNQPFASDVYDFLSRLRFEPQPRSVVLEKLGATGADYVLVESFLTDDLSTLQSTVAPHAGENRWRYFGHACVLVESSDGKNVLVDPIIAYDADPALKRFVMNDLPGRIDYVVLTHNHADHVLIETLLALRGRIETIVVPASGAGIADPSLKLMLQTIGFKNVIELSELESVGQGQLKLTALPFLGEHGDLDIRSKAAWLVEAGPNRLLFAADSNNLDPILYDRLRVIYGDIQTLFLGMECVGAPFSWAYGPLLPVAVDRKKDMSRRLNGSDFARGIKVVQSLECKEVYVYALGAEPWLQFVTSIDPDENTPPMVNARQLIARCGELGIHAERLYAIAEKNLLPG